MAAAKRHGRMDGPINFGTWTGGGHGNNGFYRAACTA